MTVATPSRFRHPIDDPDPVLSKHYRSLFAQAIAGVLPEQVETLGHALLRGDPLADSWHARCRELPASEGRRLFELALHGRRRLPSDAPEELTALFDQLETVPLWVDHQQLREGGRVFRRAGMLGQVVLADFGLMGGYRSSAVAKTLSMTGKLRFAAAERLIHTGRFVTSVTEPGMLRPGLSGFIGAARVRLVHAGVRRVLGTAPNWRSELWGLPINQADLLGTNLLFSIGFIEGCKQWGLRFADDEVRAVLHLWRYIGYLLGIEEALMPTTIESAQRALYLVGVSQPDPDLDSRELARALYELPLTFARTPWARRFVRFEMGLRVSMTRRMLGDEGVDQLGLPRSRLRILTGPLVAAIRAFDSARAHIPFADYAAYRLGDYLIKNVQTTLSDELASAKASGRRARDEPTREAQVVPDVLPFARAG